MIVKQVIMKKRYLYFFQIALLCFCNFLHAGTIVDDPITSNQVSGLDIETVHDITRELAKLAIETNPDQIPDNTYLAAKAALMDALGCAFAGYNATGINEIIEMYKYWGGREESTIWFDGTKIPVHEATFVNSVQLHAMDFDDYHPSSDTHITTVLVPAVLSVGELTNASGEEILTALILGAEVIGRLGAIYKIRRVHSGFLPTSIIGGFGVTAATCRLKKCSVEETQNAMGIWYAHASGNRQALFDRTLTKRIQPGIAARAGVFSSYLAGVGITGPTRIIGEQPASLTQIFGCDPAYELPTVSDVIKKNDSWVIEELHYKNFASCGYSDMAIEAAIEVSRENKLILSDIIKINLFGDNINSPFAGVEWVDSQTPQVLAQFCVSYAAASALKNQKYGPHEISPNKISDDLDVDSLARRTKLCSWDEWEGQKPDAPFAMQIHLSDGRVLTQTSMGNMRYIWPRDLDELILKFKENVSFSELIEDSRLNDLLYDIDNIRNTKNINEFIEKWLISRN